MIMKQNAIIKREAAMKRDAIITVSYTHLDVYKRQEVGCGQGEFLKVLSEFPVEVHGIEHDPHLVELARACLLYTSRCV